VLRLSEITLIEAITSERVIIEAERNLAEKLPAALPIFRLLVSRCVQVVTDPAADELIAFAGLAHVKDLPMLGAAVRARCPWLVTFKTRDYQPGHPTVTVLPPGSFVLRVRDRLARIAAREDERGGAIFD
jgi:hypothetical protein